MEKQLETLKFYQHTLIFCLLIVLALIAAARYAIHIHSEEAAPRVIISE